ncbi:MAG: hypothetical protein ACD_41C00018G0002 [uncultured bacterium]|nr:MAG: hypothetical protein ACD_41C00018G0002 [uncultured bacterium]
MAATVVTAYVSNKSAAIPASSPTLSPTLSAITAGLRGSSSGIPASTLPTKSAPTSAAFVKIPPPTRAKTEIKLPPKLKPISASISPPDNQVNPATPSRPRPTTNNPVTAPPWTPTFMAAAIPCRAASAVRTFARTATFIPIYPAQAEKTAPTKNPSAMAIPRANHNTTNKTTAMRAMVRYCRFRYAEAPS